eukprot:79123-Hanusia_phi.AAC.1
MEKHRQKNLLLETRRRQVRLVAVRPLNDRTVPGWASAAWKSLIQANISSPASQFPSPGNLAPPGSPRLPISSLSEVTRTAQVARFDLAIHLGLENEKYPTDSVTRLRCRPAESDGSDSDRAAARAA